MGDLNEPRSAHGVIQVDNEFIVVGGSRDDDKDESTESCIFIQQSMICTTREPQLSTFTAYPELMLFP